MGVAVVDASVLIAAIDDQDVHHARAVEELRATRKKHTLALPAVAFSETLVNPYRQGQTNGDSVAAALRRLGPVEPVTDPIALGAAQLLAQRQIKLPAALILATASELGANEILTFDDRWRSVDKRARVLT